MFVTNVVPPCRCFLNSKTPQKYNILAETGIFQNFTIPCLHVNINVAPKNLRNQAIRQPSL